VAGPVVEFGAEGATSQPIKNAANTNAQRNRGSFEMVIPAPSHKQGL
jgi:hypothetical protein